MKRNITMAVLATSALLFAAGFTPIPEVPLQEKVKPADNFLSETIERINLSFELGEYEFKIAEREMNKIPEKLQREAEERAKEAAKAAAEDAVNDAINKAKSRNRKKN